TDACGDRLNSPSRSVTVGRSTGLRLKQRCTVSTNVGGKLAGKETISDPLSGHTGGHWVRASTMVMPRAQMSPAAEIFPFIASGGSYREGLSMLALDAPAGWMVSLASFS